MPNNNVAITGNTTGDSELRFTSSGQATARFGVAVNRRWQNSQTHEWDEATSFFDIMAWGQLAENTAESLTRGDRAIVSGRLDQRSWAAEDGTKGQGRNHGRGDRHQLMGFCRGSW